MRAICINFYPNLRKAETQHVKKALRKSATSQFSWSAYCMLQIGFFIYDHISITKEGSPFGWDHNSNEFPYDHPLILNKNKQKEQKEIWRFYAHAFVHLGGQHLFFNMLLQLVTGFRSYLPFPSMRISIKHFHQEFHLK